MGRDTLDRGFIDEVEVPVLTFFQVKSKVEYARHAACKARVMISDAGTGVTNASNLEEDGRQPALCLPRAGSRPVMGRHRLDRGSRDEDEVEVPVMTFSQVKALAGYERQAVLSSLGWGRGAAAARNLDEEARQLTMCLPRTGSRHVKEDWDNEAEVLAQMNTDDDTKIVCLPRTGSRPAMGRDTLDRGSMDEDETEVPALTSAAKTRRMPCDKTTDAPKTRLRRGLTSTLSRGIAPKRTGSWIFKRGVQTAQQNVCRNEGSVVQTGGCPYVQNSVAPDDLVIHMACGEAVRHDWEKDDQWLENGERKALARAREEKRAELEAHKSLVQENLRFLEGHQLTSYVEDEKNADTAAAQHMRSPLVCLTRNGTMSSTSSVEDDGDADAAAAQQMRRTTGCLPRTGSYHHLKQERQQDAKSAYVVTLERGILSRTSSISSDYADQDHSNMALDQDASSDVEMLPPLEYDDCARMLQRMRLVRHGSWSSAESLAPINTPGDNDSAAHQTQQAQLEEGGGEIRLYGESGRRGFGGDMMGSALTASSASTSRRLADWHLRSAPTALQHIATRCNTMQHDASSASASASASRQSDWRLRVQPVTHSVRATSGYGEYIGSNDESDGSVRSGCKTPLQILARH